MEVFVDFGLFELIAGLGFAALARVLYSRQRLAAIVLALGVLVPISLLILVRGEALKWLAAANLVFALLNASVVIETLRKRAPSRVARIGMAPSHAREPDQSSA